MSDLTHEKIEISMFEGGYKCKHCGIVGFYVDWSEDCPDHPDRTEEDELTHKRGGKRCLVDHGKGCSCIECEFCGEFIRPSGFDDSCPEHPDRQREDDDELGEWVNRRANLSDFELSDDEVQNVVEFIRKNDDEVDFFSLDKEEANERLDKLIVVEATAGMLNDLSEEEQKRYREASERRPLFDEDDDDGEGDVSREIAERFMGGGSIVSIQSDDPSALKGSFEQAIREHCELSDGVCEWTYSGKINECMDSEVKTYEPGCPDTPDNPTNFPLEMDKFTHCPYCGREIEIITDEGGFEVGDVIYVKQKDTYHLVREPSVKFSVIGGDEEGRTWCEDGVTYDIEKVGEFRPDDNALERVPDEAKGELVHFGTNEIFMWPFMDVPPEARSGEHESVLVWADNGDILELNKDKMERTGIVFSFSEIAEEV